MTAPGPQLMPQPGEVVAEKYLIEKVLGEGGMGAVYQAVHQLTSKRVALKWMLPALGADPDACARFLREAQVAGRLEHPNIVSVHDVGQDRGSMFLVMELLHGETLADLLDRGALAPADAIRILMPVFRAVAAAHAAGIVHRDLKPENIFLCRDPDGRAAEPKVLDFGISKLLDTPDGLKLTRTGTIVGTLFYMAPEQITAQPVGPAADVFALGVIVFQCITGAMPYEGRTYNQLVVEVATRPARSMRALLPELDPILDAIVAHALERDPAARYSEVAAFARDLEPFAPDAQFSPGHRTWRGHGEPVPLPVAARLPPPALTADSFSLPMQPAARSGLLIGVVAGLVIALGLAAVAASVLLRGPTATATPLADDAGGPAVSVPATRPLGAPDARPEPLADTSATRPVVPEPLLPPQPVLSPPPAEPAPQGRPARRPSDVRPRDVRPSSRVPRVRVEDF